MPSQSGRTYWISRAILLGWLTIGYNLIEGLVSVFFGVEENSIALFGFGLDSFVEVFSAIAVLWRFRTELADKEIAAVELAKERKATWVIGGLFLVLATSTAIVSIYQIATGRHPETTLPGLIISALSLSFMFFLWKAKRKVGLAVDSKTVLQDAACSMACIQLSLVLFAGSVTYLVFPALYWVDSAAALVLSVLIAREGLGAIRAARSEHFTGGCCCDCKAD
ncbi:MAG: heavy metal transporter [Bdellovibrionales bacterium GWB1_55_8]|nr:MAG: heavy metal transporter [Bdellovibrionales bacterium GWB1_55_8]